MEKQKALEEEFTRELVANALAAQELGCRTQRLIQDAQRRGGAEAVRAMLARRQATPDAHLLARAGRLELSCEAPDIKSGAHDLALMPEMPESAKNTLLNGELLPVCSCVFTRTHGVFEKDGLSFVLSYDTGELSKGKAKGSICELELEHVSGDISLMEKLADDICAKYGLSPCSLSKYQRAMALMDTDEKAL